MDRATLERRAIEIYRDGYSMQKTGNQLGVGLHVIHRILKKHDVPRRSPGEYRKWQFDESFFDRNATEVAYWAGFIMADGCLSEVNNSYVLIVQIDERDRQHLETFCDAFGVNTDIIKDIHHKASGATHVRFDLGYRGFKEQLGRWGIVPNKTYNWVEPKIPRRLLPDFLRGWADGDGSWGRYGQKFPLTRFDVNGNRKALEWYRRALYRLGYGGSIGLHDYSKNGCVMYAAGRYRVIELLNLLDGMPRLGRKWKHRPVARQSRLW